MRERLTACCQARPMYLRGLDLSLCSSCGDEASINRSRPLLPGRNDAPTSSAARKLDRAPASPPAPAGARLEPIPAEVRERRVRQRYSEAAQERAARAACRPHGHVEVQAR